MAQVGSKASVIIGTATLILAVAILVVVLIQETDGPEVNPDRAERTRELANVYAAEELYPRWRDNFEQWERTGSDFGYHYMGSAIWFNRIGRAMGEAMLELMGDDE